MNDPRARVEAVARIIRQADVLPGNLTPPLDLYIGDAEQALAAADQADREQGIHRVKVGDATVERVAVALMNSSRARQGLRPLDASALSDHAHIDARAVLAALTGDES